MAAEFRAGSFCGGGGEYFQRGGISSGDDDYLVGEGGYLPLLTATEFHLSVSDRFCKNWPFLT